MMAGQNGKGRPSNHAGDAVNKNGTSTRGKLHKGLFSLTILDVLFIVILSCLLVHYIPQLKGSGHLSDFVEKAGETWLAICIQLVVVFMAILGGGSGIERCRKKQILYLRELVGFAVTVPVLISCVMSVSLVFDAEAILIKAREENTESQNVQAPANQGKPIVDTGEIIIDKEIYYFEDDPYVSSEKIDGYRGVQKGTTRQEGNEIEEAAKVVYNDMLTLSGLQTATQPTPHYESKTAIANAFHDEYIKMYKSPPDGSIPEVAQLMRQQRIYVLDAAIDCRMQADDSYKDAENRRMEAVHYIEAGDEYRTDGNMEKTEECYEQSAIWGMKALYLAIPGTDTKKMRECLKRIEIAADRMAEINGSKSYELSRAVNIYTRVVELRAAELQGTVF